MKGIRVHGSNAFVENKNQEDETSKKTFETQKLSLSIFVHIKKYMKYLSTVIIKTIFFF